MRALIISDQELVAAKLSAVAQGCGVECSAADVVGLDRTAEMVSRSRRELVMLVVPEDRQRAMTLLRELRHAVPGILVVVGAADDPRFIIRVLREGANEFVDQDDIEVDLEAALSRLRLKRQLTSGDQGQVIGVIGCGGGSGASTLAVNIAAALAKKHQRSALLDLRLAVGDQALLLDLKPVHTLGELCGRGERMDANMFQQVVTQHSTGVHLLAAPIHEEAVAQVTAHCVRQVVMLARNLFPFTVIDVDRSLGQEQLAALAQTNVVVVVLRLDMTSLCSAQRLLDQFHRLGIPPSRVRVVVNRYGQPKELPAGRAERVLGVELAHYVPNDPTTVNSGNNKGVPVVVERPNARVSRSLRRLAESLISKEEHHANGQATKGQSERGGFLNRWWPATAGQGRE